MEQSKHVFMKGWRIDSLMIDDNYPFIKKKILEQVEEMLDTALMKGELWDRTYRISMKNGFFDSEVRWESRAYGESKNTNREIARDFRLSD